MRNRRKFDISISNSDKCTCNICFKTTQVAKIRYYTQDYMSDRTGRLCKHPQKHYHEILMCAKCLDDFRRDWWASTTERTQKGFGARY